MGRWDDYRACCRATAAEDRGATFCPSCGHPLFRCAAEECSGLVTPLGHCAACVDLRLSLERGAVLAARLGECLSVPFVLRNSAATRSLSIRSVLRDGTDLPREPVPISWDRLEPGRARGFSVLTGPFAHGGLNNLRVTLVASAGFGEVQETYAFTGDVSIDVEGVDQGAPTVDFAGARLTENAVVQINPYRDAGRRRPRDADALGSRTDVALERAELFEIQQGYRGYEKPPVRVPRDVDFACAGFPACDRPPDGPLLHRPVIRCGRNGRPREGMHNALPNDLCLRVYDRSGALDREASAAISRRACDFLLQDHRLCVRSLADSAVAVNGERLGAGDVRVVSNGDSFSVPAAGRSPVRFAAVFKVAGELVTGVRFERAT